MVESDNELISYYAINKLGSVLFQIENRELQNRRKKSNDIYISTGRCHTWYYWYL